MGKVVRQGFMRKVGGLLLVVAAGLACVSLATSQAFAAQNSESGQGGFAAATGVTTQYTSFTTATTAPDWAPTNSTSSYEVYSTYLFFGIGADGNLVNYNMYMEICPIASDWSQATLWKFGEYVKSYTISGLKPNTVYKTRLRYGVDEYRMGPASNTITFKTGPNKKPALKSVGIKATNYKRTKRTGYNTNFLFWWRHPYTYYTYDYKLKTTFTFKKVPDAKYVLVKFTNVGLEYQKIVKIKKGKKKYSVTVRMPQTIYNPRKAKSTISIATYRNKTWKGYSKLWVASRKIR